MIRLVLVTGFLGSGKTTLIGRLLSSPGVPPTAVIVNEIGEVAVDHHLLRRVDERTVLLANGCVCCALRADLADELRDLLERRERFEVPWFDQVVVETTGLADPTPILMTLLGDPVIRHRYELDLVLTTVDAMHGLRGEESVKQVAAADRVVITKTDAVDVSRSAFVRRTVARLNPAADLLEVSFGDVDMGELLAPRRPGGRPLPDLEAPSGHATGVVAHSVLLDGPVEWSAFAVWLTMLLSSRDTDVLRVKGLLDVGLPGPVVLNAVQHAVHPPIHLDEWPDDDRASRLTIIARGIEPGMLERSLRAFDRAFAGAYVS